MIEKARPIRGQGVCEVHLCGRYFDIVADEWRCRKTQKAWCSKKAPDTITDAMAEDMQRLGIRVQRDGDPE